jgi:hypothetical protein
MLKSMVDPRAMAVRLLICMSPAILGVGCGSSCGLGLHGQVTVSSSADSLVPCCGGFAFRDVALSGSGDSEFDLSNVTPAGEQGSVDAFLVPTTCAKLFAGSYPSGAPLCQVYAGPATPAHVSPRVALAAGTYRVWLQGYSNNAAPASYFVDVGIWDHSCRSPLQ